MHVYYLGYIFPSWSEMPLEKWIIFTVIRWRHKTICWTKADDETDIDMKTLYTLRIFFSFFLSFFLYLIFPSFFVLSFFLNLLHCVPMSLIQSDLGERPQRQVWLLWTELYKSNFFFVGILSIAANSSVFFFTVLKDPKSFLLYMEAVQWSI